jgi:hypothetical protein
MDILDVILGGVFGAFLSLLIVIGGVAYVSREEKKAEERKRADQFGDY